MRFVLTMIGLPPITALYVRVNSGVTEMMELLGFAKHAKWSVWTNEIV